MSTHEFQSFFIISSTHFSSLLLAVAFNQFPPLNVWKFLYTKIYISVNNWIVLDSFDIQIVTTKRFLPFFSLLHSFFGFNKAVDPFCFVVCLHFPSLNRFRSFFFIYRATVFCSIVFFCYSMSLFSKSFPLCLVSMAEIAYVDGQG